MNSGYIGKTLRTNIAALGLGMIVATGAFAQSSSGNISGEAAVGDTVVIRGPDNGYHRELEIKKDGKFRISRVPTGEYHVTVKHADGTIEDTKAISVRVGSTARVQ